MTESRRSTEAPDRAVATRYEKLEIHHLALVQISMIRLLVRRLERLLRCGEGGLPIMELWTKYPQVQGT
jgi:hypothetical protein